MNRSFFLAAALFGATALSAQQTCLTTTPGFVSNNGGSAGGAIYFDLDATSSIQLEALELNFSAAVGTAVGCEVWLRSGTAFGFEGSPAGWSLVATDDGNALSAGLDAPTPITLANPACIPAGGTVGVAIVAVNTGHRYTNGTGANEIATDGTLTFTGGSGSNAPFTGTPFNPRVANATFCYTLSNCVLKAPAIAGAVDTPAGAGTLSADDETFLGGDTIRVVTNDSFGGLTGAPLAYFVNFGPAGNNPTTTTSFIPGFVQRWQGSNQPDIDLILPGLEGIENSLNVPAMFGSPGGSVRFQSLLLDATSSNPLGFPVTPSIGTKTFVVALDPAACVVSEGFEGGLTLPATWQTTAGTTPWTVDANGTTSTGTGPSAAIEGVNYLYCETSGSGFPNVLFGAETQEIDGSVTTVDGIAFQLSRVGATIGTLNVNLVDASGTVLSTIGTFSGSGPEWQQQVLPFTDPGVPYRVQFEYTSGASFTGDLAIDDVCFFDLP